MTVVVDATVELDGSAQYVAELSFTSLLLGLFPLDATRPLVS